MKNPTDIIQRYKLVAAISGAVGIALVLTIFSVLIYVRDGTARLDLSRPGYEQVRRQIKPEDKTPAFASEGTLTPEVMKSYKTELEKKLTDFKNLSTFDPSVLNSEHLGLE